MQQHTNFRLFRTNAMQEKAFNRQLFESHKLARHSLSPDSVCQLINHLLQLLFPALAEKRYNSLREFQQDMDNFQMKLFTVLDSLSDIMEPSAQAIEKAFMQDLPKIHRLLDQDADAILAGDPAATIKTEVIRTYPGFYALAIFRIAHKLWNLNVPLMPRILTEYAHAHTGIDIHPGATIGERFCIDHGTGVVIGETVNIGDDVKLYQGVTLGALSVSKDFAQTKRHPTLEDRVVIYSGATILGGETIIGHDSTIGGNVWLTKSVKPFSRIYYKASNYDHSENVSPKTDDTSPQEQ